MDRFVVREKKRAGHQDHVEVENNVDNNAERSINDRLSTGSRGGSLLSLIKCAVTAEKSTLVNSLETSNLQRKALTEQDERSKNSLLWANRKGNGLNMATVLCTDKNNSLKHNSTVGWKVVNGEKLYTTFRCGKLVKATGSEAFKLSVGDQMKRSYKDHKKDAEGTTDKHSAKDITIVTDEYQDGSHPNKRLRS